MVKQKPISLKDRLKKHIRFETSSEFPQFFEVKLKELEPNPYQTRKNFDKEKLKELAETIKTSGVLQPITVKQKDDKSGWYVVAGERRFKACQLLGLPTIPAVITNGHLAEINMIENLQRENLDPLEEAEGYFKMIEEFGYTHEILGQKLGKNRTNITTTLKLNDLPEKIKNEYRDAGVSKAVLIEITRVKDPKDQAALWGKIKNGDFRRKEVRENKAGKPAEKTNAQGVQAIKTGKIFLKILTDVQEFQKTDFEELLIIQEEFGEILSKWPFEEK